MQFEAVIFDMDGLLVDSEPLWFRIESAVVAARGRTYQPEIQKHLIGMRMDEFWGNMVRLYELEDPVEMLMGEVIAGFGQLEHDDITQKPGAQELLEYLYAEGVPCALASSSPLLVIHRVVETQGWNKYFRALVSGDQVAAGKPAPDVYLEAARQINADPTRCLALEDSRNGSRAAVAAGMTCFAVPDLSHGHFDDFDGITPHRFASLHDVLAHIRE